MKIALCLSGQPRFIDESYPYILKNVCDDYDVEVFCHFWFDEDLQTKPYKFGECGKGEWHNQRISSNAVDKVLEIYKPISYKVEPSKSFVDSSVPFQSSLKKYFHGALEDPDQEGFRNRMINNSLSYFYSLSEVNKLKKEHEYVNNFKYDWVIKCRTDAMIQTKIPFDLLDSDLIHYSNIFNQPDGMIQDWFDFGGSKQMDAFMNVFPVWQLIQEKCMNENGAWCNELMHRKMLDTFNIKTQGQPINITIPRF